MMATATARAAVRVRATGTGTTDEADLVAILHVYNEVTERLKRSHEALAGEVCRLRDELHEKNLELARRERLSALGQMAAGVAHEIRNPLGGIGLFASVLDRDLADRPAQQDIARRIGAGVQNVENIVRDILAFAGGAPPKFERASLGRILDSAMSKAAPQARVYGIAIEVDPLLRGAVLSADASQVERALLNLIFNALDAAGAGGRVWIRRGIGVPPPSPLYARGEGEEGMLEIVVEDNGPGIDPEYLHKIFNPFFTTKDGGTGLGLAIVHGIAESHGGCVRAGSRIGGGASFVLTLPAAESLKSEI
ncbi:MAG: ATP-binding protein [Phycisphaerales bacterium]|nr:ATP-binding protein [Phycisphaerales bacterium]